MQIAVLSLITMIALAGCTSGKKEADLLLFNGVVYTIDKDFSTTEAIAVKGGRIAATGSSREIRSIYRAPEVRDLKGAFIYPGWIDAHCHFVGYARDLRKADLVGTGSAEEVVQRLVRHRESHGGTWILGRGWDQNDWDVKEFPDCSILDKQFPGVPVYLERIDGHAAWVNSVAMELAGIHGATSVEGGRVVLKEGQPTGILVDNAMNLVGNLVPEPSGEELVSALRQAQENCFSVGLTSIQDAGLDPEEVDLLDSLQDSGDLTIRVNAWLHPSDENIRRFVRNGPLQSERLTVNTIKLYADGALGSRGARMIEPYSDDPGNRGLFITSPDSIESICRLAFRNGFSVATHAIGDEANRTVLKIYGKILGGINDRRWRIEHAQVIQPDDFGLFRKYSIVPSVQPTHATSDMYWAEKRIGPERMAGAYAYRHLLDQNGWLASGSDFPVESINPVYGFYAAVVRKDQSGYPPEGFMTEESLTRRQALMAMTLWAARAGFEEQMKGSIEAGKLADLVVTDRDLMTEPEGSIFNIGVRSTYVGGVLVYDKGAEEAGDGNGTTGQGYRKMN